MIGSREFPKERGMVLVTSLLLLLVVTILAISMFRSFGVDEKIAGNIEEVRARGGKVIALIDEDDEHLGALADEAVRIPAAAALLAPLVATVPLQLLAYHVADLRGNDVDQPRNLAKSVTVE